MNPKKRYLACLVALAACLALLVGCAPQTENYNESATNDEPLLDDSVDTLQTPAAKSVNVENINALIQKTDEQLGKTTELLTKRTSERDTLSAQFRSDIRGKGQAPQEVIDRIVKKSDTGVKPAWLKTAEITWNEWQKIERDVLIFTRQKERLESNKQKLAQSLKDLKRAEENRQAYVKGEDPELDKLIATAEVDIDSLKPTSNLTEAQQAEINNEAYKAMTQRAQTTATTIPGLEFDSLDQLPAFPDLDKAAESVDDSVMKSVMKRVANEGNRIIANAKQMAQKYLTEKQPESACVAWQDAIIQLRATISPLESNCSARQPLLDELNKMDSEVRKILCKPYETAFIENVTRLEQAEASDDPWDAIMEALEGLVRQNQSAIQESTDIQDTIEKLAGHLYYLSKRQDMQANVILQRMKNVLEKAKYMTKAEIWASDPTRPAGTRNVKTLNGVEFAFRWCPPGSFTMGSPESEEDRNDDETQHKVAISEGFWLMETEVTQAQWQAVMGNTPSYFKGDNLPVECVSWDDCQEFCKKAKSLGLPLALPSEARWEYACRAGTTGPYAGDLDAMAWYSSNSGDKTHPVGAKKPNAWGLYDMHGNVWEWCADVYNCDISSIETDIAVSGSGSCRVYRGGGWDDFAWLCRSAFRYGDTPDYRDGYLGLRCCLAQL